MKALNPKPSALNPFKEKDVIFAARCRAQSHNLKILKSSSIGHQLQSSWFGSLRFRAALQTLVIP